ncbi:MAG: 2Fe-2S iron-sulfur cluster-binding protein [Rhodobacter sp.]|nr:2Fe-2S iron-sulfur cluster-binding protein [Rhodobacter sp.]
MTISFTVNGIPHDVPDGRGTDTLLDFLHDDLNLTGTKLCCGIGVCRACTVAVSKGPTDAPAPVISCSTPLRLLGNSHIRTVESLAEGDRLSPVQQAFLDHFSFQCGYCAPGFVMAATIFLEGLAKNPIDRADLDAAIEGALGEHICRCTGYVRYYEAVRHLALQLVGLKWGSVR